MCSNQEPALVSNVNPLYYSFSHTYVELHVVASFSLTVQELQLLHSTGQTFHWGLCTS